MMCTFGLLNNQECDVLNTPVCVHYALVGVYPCVLPAEKHEYAQTVWFYHLHNCDNY